MNKKKVIGLGLAAVTALGLAACSSHKAKSSSTNSSLKVAMVTDVGGIDDKSFNQSAWEGLQAWGKKHNLKKGKGYDYFQSTNESEYTNNLDTAVSGGYQLIFGIGFALHDAVEDAADNNTDTNFVLIDDEIKKKDNVASVLFADNEAAYLAGIVAAKTTKTKTVGFVGGQESTVIDRFEAGFKAGVKSVDDTIQVKVNYVGSFGDAAKGKTIAAAQYAEGADVIYHAAGGSGTGVFSEAKSINESRNEADKVWVIGVDRNQKEDGNYKSKDGQTSNFVLASTIKEVGKAVQLISDDTLDGKFPGGKTTRYGLKVGGVDIALTNTSADTNAAVKEAKQKIIDGDIKIPEK